MAGRGSKRRRPRPHGVASERQALQPTRQYWTALKPWGRCWAMRSGPTGARDGLGARFRSTADFADEARRSLRRQSLPSRQGLSWLAARPWGRPATEGPNPRPRDPLACVATRKRRGRWWCWRRRRRSVRGGRAEGRPPPWHRAAVLAGARVVRRQR